MQQEFKMKSEKKVYSKPIMEVVEMDYCACIMACSDGIICDDVIDVGSDETVDETTEP